MHPNWKVRSKTVIIHRWYATVYKTPQKLLELINEFGKVAGYKINIQKSMAFLYANNESLEREIKKTIPFIIAATKSMWNKFNQGGKKPALRKL